MRLATVFPITGSLLSTDSCDKSYQIFQSQYRLLSEYDFSESKVALSSPNEAEISSEVTENSNRDPGNKEQVVVADAQTVLSEENPSKLSSNASAGQ